jgi:hypothetical protein
MVWRVSPTYKKSIIQIETWQKDDLVATYEVGWRWGHFDFATKPTIESPSDDDERIEISEFGDVIDSEQDDGCWAEWTWPDDLDEDEVERLEGLMEEEGSFALEGEEWENVETEYFISGPFTIEFIADCYTIKPIVVQAYQYSSDDVDTAKVFCDVFDTQFATTIADKDWIIKEGDGSFSLCKPDEFEDKYEKTWKSYGSES